MEMIKKRYPAFEAMILRDLMFNRSLKSGLVSFCMGVGLTATTVSPMAGYDRGHSFFLKMAMVAEF